jgi:hypothetical protein
MSSSHKSALVQPRRYARSTPDSDRSTDVVGFFGAFFLDKTSRLYGQKASAFLVIGSDIAPIVIRSHLLASVFGLTGQRKRNLINVLK